MVRTSHKQAVHMQRLVGGTWNISALITGTDECRGWELLWNTLLAFWYRLEKLPPLDRGIPQKPKG